METVVRNPILVLLETDHVINNETGSKITCPHMNGAPCSPACSSFNYFKGKHFDKLFIPELKCSAGVTFYDEAHCVFSGDVKIGLVYKDNREKTK